MLNLLAFIGENESAIRIVVPLILAELLRDFRCIIIIIIVASQQGNL
jgi:hypothetical protein